MHQCVSCLVTLTALGIFRSVGKLGKCAYAENTWKKNQNYLLSL